MDVSRSDIETRFTSGYRWLQEVIDDERPNSGGLAERIAHSADPNKSNPNLDRNPNLLSDFGIKVHVLIV